MRIRTCAGAPFTCTHEADEGTGTHLNETRLDRMDFRLCGRDKALVGVCCCALALVGPQTCPQIHPLTDKQTNRQNDRRTHQLNEPVLFVRPMFAEALLACTHNMARTTGQDKAMCGSVHCLSLSVSPLGSHV